MRIEELLLSWKGSSDLACSGWLDPICMWRHFRTLATNAGGEPLDWRRERWQIVRVCKDIAANTLLFMVCLPRFGTIMVTRCRGIGRDSLWAARISSIVVIQKSEIYFRRPKVIESVHGILFRKLCAGSQYSIALANSGQVFFSSTLRKFLFNLFPLHRLNLDD